MQIIHRKRNVIKNNGKRQKNIVSGERATKKMKNAENEKSLEVALTSNWLCAMQSTYYVYCLHITEHQSITHILDSASKQT